MARCRQLDKRIYDDALAAGNVKYAEILAGNYRLVMAAHKLFQDDEGHMLYFSKENKSNGCVNTVDLTYPECPLYLLYNPELQKGMILSILEYALSDARQGKNCAAHDLGQYPLANGQVYGDSMPLEESANIILLANAICRITGDGEWLKPYRNVLKTWATYCHNEGQNPGNQLCTDDFKGPSEQNTNLSVKAILAVAAYAELIPYIGGNVRDIAKFEQYSKNMALLWEADARDGDHYRMQFNKAGTWSQKYNLVWDVMWGKNLFPKEVVDREINYYLTKQAAYGLPLDSRDSQTKVDWIAWTASMSPNTETFLKFHAADIIKGIDPVNFCQNGFGCLRGNLASIRSVDLIAIVFGRIVRGGHHDSGRTVQFTDGKGQARSGHQLRINPYLNAIGCKNTGSHLRKQVRLDPGIIADRNPALFRRKMGNDVIGQSLRSFPDRVDIHPVRAGTNHPAQTACAEFQFPVKGILDQLRLSGHGSQFRAQVRISVCPFTPSQIVLFNIHPIAS